MELKAKSDIIKNLLDTQSAVVEPLSRSKDQQNQLTSLEKQKVTDQSNKVSNQYLSNQHQNHQQDNQHQNHRHNNNHKSKHQTHDDVDQQIQKQHIETNQQEKQTCKTLYVGNLNKDITEEDLNQLLGQKTTVYFRQTCSIEMPLDKNTGKSIGFAFFNVPQHIYNELVKLNGTEFQNHFIRIEEARATKQTRGVPSNKQNRPNPTLMPKVNNVVIFGDNIVNFNRKFKYKTNKGLQSGRAQFKYFPGATSKDLFHYIDRTFEDHCSEVIVIHIGVNDITSVNKVAIN